MFKLIYKYSDSFKKKKLKRNKIKKIDEKLVDF